MSQDIKPTKLHNDIIKTKSNEPTHQSACQLTTSISPIAQAQPTQPSRLVKSVLTSLFTLYAKNLKSLFRRKHAPLSTTSDPPTMEESSPGRYRTEHFVKATSQVTHKIQVRLQNLGLLNHYS